MTKAGGFEWFSQVPSSPSDSFVICPTASVALKRAGVDDGGLRMIVDFSTLGQNVPSLSKLVVSHHHQLRVSWKK